jgi:hypothetical protein
MQPTITIAPLGYSIDEETNPWTKVGDSEPVFAFSHSPVSSTLCSILSGSPVMPPASRQPLAVS